MANGEHWFEDMAKALKRQEHAFRMLNKWQDELAEARQLVTALAAQAQDGHVAEHSTDQEQEQLNAV